jgi:hypothetical protein
MPMQSNCVRRFAAALLLSFATTASHAALYGNIATNPPIEFPLGALSFADELVSFAPGLQDNGTGVIEPLPVFRNGLHTLGAPNMLSLFDTLPCFNLATQSDTTCRFASLGNGGSLVVKFTDNRLVGSGTSADDLWIFEVGITEPSFVDISKDGINWFSVGAIGTAASPGPGVDIDEYGFGPTDLFAYVRLTDILGSGQISGPTLGEDVDAIGAISSVAAPVPVPAALWLLGSALGLLAIGKRRSVLQPN